MKKKYIISEKVHAWILNSVLSALDFYFHNFLVPITYTWYAMNLKKKQSLQCLLIEKFDWCLVFDFGYQSLLNCVYDVRRKQNHGDCDTCVRWKCWKKFRCNQNVHNYGITLTLQCLIDLVFFKISLKSVDSRFLPNCFYQHVFFLSCVVFKNKRYASEYNPLLINEKL